MTLLAKMFIGFVLACTAGVCATGGLLAMWVHQTGWIGVRVDSADGPQFGLKVPAALADLAVRATPDHVIDDALDEARREMAPMLPAIREVRRELADAPDFVIVEVRDGAEHVRVLKSGKHVIVEVDSGDGSERVRVTLPLSALDTVNRLLAS